MDLFIVNRHDEESIATDTKEVDENKDELAEQQKLSKLLKLVEKRKARNQKCKEIKAQRKQEKKEIATKEIERRQEKRLFTKDSFFDENVKTHTEKNVNQGANQKDLEGFTILGNKNFKKKTEVKRVLPNWLSNPTVISVDLQNLQTKTSDLKLLNKSLRSKLKESGIKYFFPVQAEVIPWLLKCNKIRNCIQPNDICVSAPTGSGKTLAFVLPIVQALQNNFTTHVRALVILPTQGLALQVFKAFRKFTEDTGLSVCCITGSSSFELEQKQLVSNDAAFGYSSKVDIVVSTAGRLVHHIKKTPGFNLEHLQFLVIDEADRVLDNVQNDWLYHLEKHIHNEGLIHFNRFLNLKHLSQRRPPQKLLFSATLSQDPEKLQKLSLFQPKLFTSIVEGAENDDDELAERFIGKFTTPKELTEKYILCSLDVRPLVLYDFIKTEGLTKTLVFTHSWDAAHRLTVLLRSLFKEEKRIEEIGSIVSRHVRNKLIEDFENGKIDLLISTDALTRGIDLAGVKCVVSYSAPKYVKTYIHRVGRTARAGEPGLAVTLTDKNQMPLFKKMLEFAGKKNLQEISIDEEKLEPLVKEYQDALSSLKQTIDEEETKEIKAKKAAKRIPKKRKREDDK